MEVSIFKIHFKLYIFIQYVKVLEIGLLFLIITLLLFLHFAFSFPLLMHCAANHASYSSTMKPLKKSDEVMAGFAQFEGTKSLFAKMPNTDAWDVRKPGFHQLVLLFFLLNYPSPDVHSQAFG